MLLVSVFAVFYLRSRRAHATANRLAEENARLLLQDAQLQVIQRLALAAEYRDDETGQHTRRVGDLSALIGAALGMPDERPSLQGRLDRGGGREGDRRSDGTPVRPRRRRGVQCACCRTSISRTVTRIRRATERTCSRPRRVRPTSCCAGARGAADGGAGVLRTGPAPEPDPSRPTSGEAACEATGGANGSWAHASRPGGLSPRSSGRSPVTVNARRCGRPAKTRSRSARPSTAPATRRRAPTALR